MNIVSTIIGMAGPAVIDKIAAALGINSDLARRALTMAVPALLAAFGAKAASPGGARSLFDAVSGADADIGGKLGSMLTGAKSGSFFESGTGGLSSLLGGGALNSITGAVAKQAGISGDSGASLMAIAGQLAMGGLAKQVKTSGLDASGLASLMSSQQSNISSALPAGLGGVLSAAGLGGFGDQARTMAADAGRNAKAMASQQAAFASKGGTNWLMWLIPIAVIAAALWYFLGRGPAPVAPTAEVAKPAETTTEPAAKTAEPAAKTAEPATDPAAKTAESTTTDPVAATTGMAAMTIDGVDVGKQVTGALDGLKAALGGVTDAATATAALPKITEAGKSIDGVTALMAKFSPEQKTGLASLITAALPALKEAATKALAIEGVGAVLKPAVDGLMGKLDGLAKPA